MSDQKKRKRKIRSHVKRLKIQQKKNPVSPAKYRELLRKARRKDFGRRFATVIITVGVVILLLFAGANLYVKKVTGVTIKQCIQEAKDVVRESKPEDFRLSETSYIYSDNGTELAQLASDTDATYLKYEDIPADVVNAFVAVEDRSFWENSGIDLKGILRVCLDYVVSRGQKETGASTITQQLARTEFLTQDKTMNRKIKEIFISLELTKKYSKEQIMEFYCNTCCFANGIYGVEDAAQTYFGRPVSELSLSETAYICAIPNRPEYYNPYNDSEHAITRRDKILQDMYDCGYISEDEGVLALNEEMEITEKKKNEDFYNYEVTYAINCAVRYLMQLEGFEFRYTFESEEDYKEYNKLYNEEYEQAKHTLYTGGYKITTTMNLLAQQQLQDVLDDNLAFSEDKVEETGIYELQGAMTVIDNETGKVVAMIGGRSQEETGQTYSLNRGFQGFAQPGSSFKPLAVYAPALNDGYDASSQLKEIDVDKAKKSTSEEISKMHGSSMSLRSAVENSKNGCAYWLFNIIGPRTGLSYVTDMNFTRIVPQDYTLSAALGGLTHGVSTVEMANAYSTLENHGEFTPTDCISSILDRDGKEIYEEPESRRIYSEDAADEMTDIMMGVLKRGTASRLRWSSETDTDAAGKTGTTNDYKAGWFCGYTPYYTIAVWVGCDTPKTVSNLSGNTYPAYIWKDAMLSMISGLPEEEFDIEKSSSYQPSNTNEKTDAEKKAEEEKKKQEEEEKKKQEEQKKKEEEEKKKQEEQKKKEEEEKKKQQEQADEIQGNDIVPDQPKEEDPKEDTSQNDPQTSQPDASEQPKEPDQAQGSKEPATSEGDQKPSPDKNTDASQNPSSDGQKAPADQKTSE